MNPIEILEKYYDKNGESYNILIKHSEAVKTKALEVADKHPELGLDRTFVAEAAMLHDIGIFLCDAPRIYCFGQHKYIEHGYLGADIVRKEGFPHHAMVCERHTGAGLSLEQIITDNLPVPHRDMIPVTLEEQLICYADKFFSKSKLDITASLEKIRTTLAQHGKDQVERFNRWHEMFK